MGPPSLAPDDKVGLTAAGITAAGVTATGLDAAEAAAYEMVIRLPGATVAELADSWLRTEQLADVLARLEQTGFVLRDDGEPAHYQAVDPDVVLEAPLREYEDRLHQARERLRQLAQAHRARFVTGRTTSTLEVVSGRSAVLDRLDRIQREAREEVQCLDRPPYANNSDNVESGVGLLRRGVRCRTIYERASLEHPRALRAMDELLSSGQEVRVLPTLPVKLYLADRQHALLPLHPGTTSITAAVYVGESALLSALVELFEGLWQRALPLHPIEPRPAARSLPTTADPVGQQPTAEERRLIALLLSGLTDEAVARQLGIGYRTAQRRIAALMTTLGARTRFQAGVQAARWQRRTTGQ